MWCTGTCRWPCRLCNRGHVKYEAHSTWRWPCSALACMGCRLAKEDDSWRPVRETSVSADAGKPRRVRLRSISTMHIYICTTPVSLKKLRPPPSPQFPQFQVQFSVEACMLLHRLGGHLTSPTCIGDVGHDKPVHCQAFWNIYVDITHSSPLRTCRPPTSRCQHANLQIVMASRSSGLLMNKTNGTPRILCHRLLEAVPAFSDVCRPLRPRRLEAHDQAGWCAHDCLARSKTGPTCGCSCLAWKSRKPEEGVGQ